MRLWRKWGVQDGIVRVDRDLLANLRYRSGYLDTQGYTTHKSGQHADQQINTEAHTTTRHAGNVENRTEKIQKSQKLSISAHESCRISHNFLESCFRYSEQHPPSCGALWFCSVAVRIFENSVFGMAGAH